MSQTFVMLFALAAAITGSAFAQTTATTRTTDYSFPLVGLATTETIGVNLINLASNTTKENASCSGSVTYYNAFGPVGTPTTFALSAGATASVNLTFSNAGISATRGLIRAVVELTTMLNVPCSLSYSLNTFDVSSGVTHVFIAGPSSTQVSPTVR